MLNIRTKIVRNFKNSSLIKNKTRQDIWAFSVSINITSNSLDENFPIFPCKKDRGKGLFPVVYYVHLGIGYDY
jgi:hypothetical protein